MVYDRYMIESKNIPTIPPPYRGGMWYMTGILFLWKKY